MYLARAESLGMPIREHVESGRVVVQQVDPAELSPGEFAYGVRRAAEVAEARLVFIDSLNGLLAAMPEENFVALQLHELLAYLSQRGILTVMTLAQHGLVGSQTDTPIDVSYLADSVLLFRYFESIGHVRKALSVVKKRSGYHEATIRELTLRNAGVKVGPPLEQFEGVLTGAPRRTNAATPPSVDANG
jgi:circadian clock protein KaiC